MTFARTASLILISLTLLGAGVSATSAAPAFGQVHPRRAQVIHRAEHQIHRANIARREGELSARNARAIRAADRHVIRQQRRMAMHQNGHITRAQQAHLNQEENRIGQHIPG